MALFRAVGAITAFTRVLSTWILLLQLGATQRLYVFHRGLRPPLATYSSTDLQGYYAPNASRPNLVLISKTQATRVVFDTSSGEPRAIGVEVVKADGAKEVIKAEKEVILSAGSYQTPQLLELSGILRIFVSTSHGINAAVSTGIGKKDVLEKYGIPQLVDLPVGENMRTPCYLTYPDRAAS